MKGGVAKHKKDSNPSSTAEHTCHSRRQGLLEYMLIVFCKLAWEPVHGRTHMETNLDTTLLVYVKKQSCLFSRHNGEVDLPCSHYLIELGDTLPRFVMKVCARQSRDWSRYHQTEPQPNLCGG